MKDSWSLRWGVTHEALKSCWRQREPYLPQGTWTALSPVGSTLWVRATLFHFYPAIFTLAAVMADRTHTVRPISCFMNLF